MKRITKFLIALLVCLLVAYSYPVLFPKNESKKNQPALQVKNQYRTSLSIEPIGSDGFSKYIGSTMTEFEDEFGQSNDKFVTPLGYTWAVYGSSQRDYFQVSYRGDRVNSIFSLGSKNQIEPFQLGMELSDVSDITTIYSTFFMEYDNLEYEIELTEEDMNYRPLIAFDNGSFAILHFDQSKGKLLAIRYLDEQTLLELMPYQLMEGNALDLQIADEFDWTTFDVKNRYQFKQILSILRKENKLNEYRLIDSLNITTEEAVKKLVDEPSKFLSGEELSLWEIHEENLSFYQPFYLEQRKTAQVLKEIGKETNASGILYSPAYDVPWLIMTLFNERFFQTQFQRNQEYWLGVSFYKDAVLFVTADPEKLKTVDTMSSGEDEK